MTESYTPGRGVFSIFTIRGTNDVLLLPMLYENHGKSELLRVGDTTPPGRDELLPLLPGMLETVGGMVHPSDESDMAAMQREMVEEGSNVLRAVDSRELQAIALAFSAICYQFRPLDEGLFALDVVPFHLPLDAERIQKTVDGGEARIVSLDDVEAIMSVVRPYQAAFLRLIIEGKVCLPTR